jgi:hypothetical protein
VSLERAVRLRFCLVALIVTVGCSQSGGPAGVSASGDPTTRTRPSLERESNPVVAEKPADATAPTTSDEPTVSDDTLEQLAADLISVCPTAAPDDAEARERCRSALADHSLLRDLSADPLLWGAQPAGLATELVPEQASLTRFNPRVWRTIYLSTLMFEGPAVLESAGRYRVLRLPSRFRNGLDSGDYPYPFWHAPNKWLSYERSTQLIFLFEGERLVAAFRSEQLDTARAHVERSWDGAWTWEDGKEPHITLFRALFSQDNPFVTQLDASYRELAEGLREQTCTTCHSPNNLGNQKPLDLLNYPNQGLSGRHRIVRILEENKMPPDVGIADEGARLALLARAQEFAELGDKALAFEGEPVNSGSEENE